MLERSFGIIPLRYINKRWEALFVKHGKGHWAFPKGHPEPEESSQQTAIRELKEETGLDLKRFLSTEPLKEAYHFKREGILISKEVVYFVAEVRGEVEMQVEEISDFRWVTLEEGALLATFPESKNIVNQTALLLSSIKSEME